MVDHCEPRLTTFGAFSDDFMKTNLLCLNLVSMFFNKFNLSKVDIKIAADEEYSVNFTQHPPTGVKHSNNYYGYKTGINTENQLYFPDPRCSDFGHRYLSKDIKEPTEHELSYYNYRRHEHCIPEGIKEIPMKKCTPLTYNLDWLHGVSFAKGCYLGQELTQRTHFSGAVSKRLVPVVGDFKEAKPSRRPACEIISSAEFKGEKISMAMVRLQRLKELKKDYGVELKLPVWMRNKFRPTSNGYRDSEKN